MVTKPLWLAPGDGRQGQKRSSRAASQKELGFKFKISTIHVGNQGACVHCH